MKVTLLGTGSPIPDPLRAGPATLVRSLGANVLFDCGRGVVTRLAGAGLFPTMLSAVMLTHLHSDHVCDLNDVITTQWVMSATPAPLVVVGPRGTNDLVTRTLDMLSPDIGYRLAHHADLERGPWLEVREVAAGERFALGDLDVLVGATDHRPVEPTLGYRLSQGGQNVVIAGDGVPCATLDELVLGADAYVQAVLRDDLVRAIPSARLQDILDYHSTVAQAAQTAQRGNVKALVLTHFVPAPSQATEPQWRDLAKQFTGLLVLGDDLTTLDLDTMTVL